MSEVVRNAQGRVVFTKDMKKEYTILAPNMLPIHFEFVQIIARDYGYKLELLNNTGAQVVQEGLKYVHNDTCYPALLCVGQMIDALKSGKYDTSKTALLMTQTGGGCRASNYIHLIRKAVKKAGYPDMPIISANLSGLEKNPGFKLSLSMIRKVAAALFYGDLLMLLSNQTRPYEVNKGQTDSLVEHFIQDIAAEFERGRGLGVGDMRKNFERIAAEFNEIPVNITPKVKVGIVGEIYVKYAAFANNHLEEFLASQDCEVMVPGVMGFAFYCLFNAQHDVELYGGSAAKTKAIGVLINYFKKMERAMLRAVKQYPRFTVPASFDELTELVEGTIGHGCKMGEGWLLTAEMIELNEHGFENIICAQPFGCLPNHIVGKGMIRKLRNTYPNSNITPIDYDPSATKVNQENRIKLMLAIARERLKAQQEEAAAKTEERDIPLIRAAGA